MIDLLSLGLQPGQKLRIRTKNEIVLGKFNRTSSDGSRMQVAEPQLLDGTKLGKTLWYFKEHIENIKAENLDVTAEIKSDIVEKDKFMPSISKAQSDRIQAMMDNAELINQVNTKYYEALKDISESHFIGLYAENAHYGRVLKAEFLQISTSYKLYVYDLRQLKATALFEDLRPILETQAYLKIVFDSRLLLDNLNYHYNLKISPVCDLVLNINHESPFRDLNHCVEEIFGIKTCDSEQKNESIWRRPVVHDQLVTLSSKVAYLIPLYAQINQLKLLETYGKDIEDYTSVSKDDLFKDVCSNNRHKLQNMIRKRHGGSDSKEE